MPSSNESYYVEPFERKDKSENTYGPQRRAVIMVRHFMERSKWYREPHLNLARQSREMYETWQPTSRSVIQRANLKLPYGFTVVESEVPQLMDIFFRNGNSIRFQGRDFEDAVWENLITDFHSHQFDEMKFETKSMAFTKNCLLDGTAFAKVPYRFKEIETVRRESRVDPTTGEVVRDKVPVLEVAFDGPDMEVIPIYDFFPDWSVKEPGNIQSMRGCVHRMYRTFAELKNAGIYKNLDEVNLSVSTKGVAAWSTPYFVDDNFKQQFERLQDNHRHGIKDRGKIEIWEYWGLFDPNGDGRFKEYLITVANGDVIIRMEENFYDAKFKPFVACPNFIRPNEFYGIPELISIRALIKEANTIRNARLDNINLSVNPMWLVDRAAGIDQRALYSKPNGLIYTNDMNGIQPLRPQDPSIGSKDEMAFIQQDIQNATALINSTPMLSQLGKQFGRSATGVSFIQGIAGSRLGLKARLLADLFYKPVAWIMLMTNRQFVTQPKWVRVSDPNAPNPFEQLAPDAFYRKYDFVVQTNLEHGGPEAQFQKMQSVAQIAQVFENSQPGTFKTEELLEPLLRPLVGRQAKRFIRSDEERAELQAQQLAQQQAVNAAQGQAAPQPNAEGGGVGAPAQQIQSALGIIGGE